MKGQDEKEEEEDKFGSADVDINDDEHNNDGGDANYDVKIISSP